MHLVQDAYSAWVHEGRPTITDHFGDTYLTMFDVFYTTYAYFFRTIFAEMPTYPKIGRPL